MSRRPRSVLTHAAAFLSGAFLALLASNAAHLAVHDNNYSNVVDHDEMMISARRRQQQQKQGFVASSSVGGGGWGLGQGAVGCAASASVNTALPGSDWCMMP